MIRMLKIMHSHEMKYFFGNLKMAIFWINFKFVSPRMICTYSTDCSYWEKIIMMILTLFEIITAVQQVQN